MSVFAAGTPMKDLVEGDLVCAVGPTGRFMFVVYLSHKRSIMMIRDLDGDTRFFVRDWMKRATISFGGPVGPV